MMEKTDDVRMHGALHATAPPTPQPNRSSSVTGPSDRGRESLTPEDSRTLRANGQTNVTNTKRQPDGPSPATKHGASQATETGFPTPGFSSHAPVITVRDTHMCTHSRSRYTCPAA